MYNLVQKNVREVSFYVRKNVSLHRYLVQKNVAHYHI